MKKLLLILVAIFAIGGATFAQEYYFDFNPSDFADNAGITSFVQIDGTYVEESDPWDQIEVAAFVLVDGVEQCRGHQFMSSYVEWGDPYPLFEMQVYYTLNNGQGVGDPIFFKMHNHATGQDYVGTPSIEMVTGEWYGDEIIMGEYDVAPYVNFTTPEPTVIYWNNPEDWTIPGEDDNVIIPANTTVIIPPGYTAWADGITLGENSKLIIKDSGQLKLNSTVEVTMEKDIAKWTVENDVPDGYYLISSPLTTEAIVSGLIGTTEETYDLYTFDPTQELEWINYDDDPTHVNFNSDINNPFVLTLGYLYANQADTTITFQGTTAHYSRETTVTYEYTFDDESTDYWNGWQLVGNPFTCDATISYVDDFGGELPADFYIMNGNGDGFDLAGDSDLDPVAVLPPLTGAFINFSEAGSGTVQFYSESEDGSIGKGSIGFKLSQGRNKVDQGRIRFGRGYNLKHLSFRRNSSKVYMPVNGNDYAVVYTENQGEMPVSFKAENNGTYTLSFNTNNVKIGYLHLIDNMTGNDVDLLANPSYTFEAKTTDYANRFKLVFASGNADEDFAFFSNGSFVINNEGNATLQVIDVNGRILSSETINGCANVNVNAAPGVYMIRLVNGDNVKVQKVVVK